MIYTQRVPLALQQKALRDLHRSFYIFATVIVFFAILGFVFIVWYFGAFSFPNNTNNGSASSMNGLNTTNSSSSRSEYLRASTVLFDSFPMLTEALGTLLGQEGGMPGVFESTQTAVWLFSTAYINTSSPTGGFSTVTKHNVIMLVDARSGNSVKTSYYTDILTDDMHVTSMVGIGTSIYLFYSNRLSNTYGIGKLYYNNNILSFAIVHNDLLLPGPIIMATSTSTTALLYYQRGAHIELLALPRYVFEVLVHNGQLWSYFKMGNAIPLDSSALLNITNSADKYIYPLNLDGDGATLYSVEWNEYWSQYVMLSVKDNQVSLWHSASPEGPFTQQTSFLRQTVSDDVTHTYFHKEMWRGGGRVMVFSYCTKGNSGSLPHLAEIECCNIENALMCK